jgi:acetyl-CoA C-acetyltransferase
VGFEDHRLDVDHVPGAQGLQAGQQLVRNDQDLGVKLGRRTGLVRYPGVAPAQEPAGRLRLDGYQARGLKLPRKVERFERDEHVRPSPLDVLRKLRSAFASDGVQTGGNSSAIVDGAAGVLVASGEYVRAHGLAPLARIVGGATVAVPPEIMGIGPAPAIRALIRHAGVDVRRIDRFEINEAFGAQYLAVERELELDRARVNVNGGAIAIGHPLAASGVRLTTTVARELRRAGGEFAISSACAGGGQGVAILLQRAG